MREGTAEESQVKAELPAETKDWLPGKVGYRNDVGHYPGVMLKIFRGENREIPTTGEQTWVDSSQVANEYFALNPGLLLVDVRFASEDILALFTKVISAEEKEEWDEVSREARRLLDERKAERNRRQEAAEEASNAARKKAAEEAQAKEKEDKRLIELGKRHEKNCGKKAAQ